ncbi:MAG: fumarylacetoacetate hydrolase family protein, partial [Acidimicrobiia bacterium]
MRLVSFTAETGRRIGILAGDSVIDLSALDPTLTDMVDLIGRGVSALDALAARAGAGRPIEQVRIEAPLRPRKNVIAIGRNYLEHIREAPGPDAASRPSPAYPMVFTKPPTAVIGPGQAIDTSNDPSDTTDYEGELAVVIGTEGKRITAEAAWDHVFGYTIVNDVTARAIQRRHGQWFVGKGPDTFCPMGPCIVTADEIDDVESLWVRTTVNGEERQAASVADLIFDIPTLIATLSSVMTLEPGDVIATGTPSGVGMGIDPP